MEENPSKIWEQCLKFIRENVSDQQYKTWFTRIVFESYSESTRTLLVQVPSPFVYEYLEEYYVELMSKVLTKFFGQNVRLTYRVLTDKAHNLSQDVESEPVTATVATAATSRGNKTPTSLDAAQPQQLNPQLNPNQNFSNYIEGNSNKLPRSVGMSIAEHPNKTTFNPFFIYGP